jgi:hypothetical protein
VLAQSSTPDRISILRPAVQARPDLQYVRASGLAQVRLQLAVLSGNRRRALEQIDRLVALDKELERIAEGSVAIAPPLERLADELADQRLAIASEKLALTSQISLPRLEPAFGAGMGAALAPDEEIEIVEDEALRSHFTRLLAWGAGFLVLCAGVAAATMTQL